jgi:hypothetical protein
VTQSSLGKTKVICFYTNSGLRNDVTKPKPFYLPRSSFIPCGVHIPLPGHEQEARS